MMFLPGVHDLLLYAAWRVQVLENDGKFEILPNHHGVIGERNRM